jgi:predicted PolB exonuclease-like 3'-5' exonuclease
LDSDLFLRFCKNIFDIEVIEMRSPKQELEEPDFSDFQNEFWDENNCMRWYLVMRAFESLSNKDV